MPLELPISNKLPGLVDRLYVIPLVVPSASDAEAVIPTEAPDPAFSANVAVDASSSLIAVTSNSSTSVTAML